jgi:polysaccharide export outer membrane protein
MKIFTNALVVVILFSFGSQCLLADDVALRTGDQVSIRLAGVPAEDGAQVSGIYTVDGAGNINLPYLGKIHASDLKQAEVQSSIENAYKSSGIYTTPIITLSVQFDRLVDVEGDVRAPQRVRYTPDLTLLGAIAATGGFTDYADESKVSILRGGKRIFVNVKKVRKSTESDPGLQPGDKVSVPRSFW